MKESALSRGETRRSSKNHPGNLLLQYYYFRPQNVQYAFVIPFYSYMYHCPVGEVKDTSRITQDANTSFR